MNTAHDFAANAPADLGELIRQAVLMRPGIGGVRVEVCHDDGPKISVAVEQIPFPPADSGADVQTMPNGLKVLSRRHHEFNFLYREIFEDRAYLRHGITLPSDAVVLDVGANIGMFSVFVKMLAPSAQIYAFEPAKQVFDLLVRNTNRDDVICVPVGLGATNTMQPFTFYPNVSLLSGLHADPQRDRKLFELVLTEQMRRLGIDLPGEIMAAVDDDMLTCERYDIHVRTLAHIFESLRLPWVDLLKIDTEGGEYEMLAEAPDEIFGRIGQIVAEAEAEYSDDISKLLRAQGFAVRRHAGSAGAGLDILYARRLERTGVTRHRPAPASLRGQIEALVRTVCPVACDVSVSVRGPDTQAL